MIFSLEKGRSTPLFLLCPQQPKTSKKHHRENDKRKWQAFTSEGVWGIWDIKMVVNLHKDAAPRPGKTTIVEVSSEVLNFIFGHSSWINPLSRFFLPSSTKETDWSLFFLLFFLLWLSEDWRVTFDCDPPALMDDDRTIEGPHPLRQENQGPPKPQRNRRFFAMTWSFFLLKRTRMMTHMLYEI